MAAEIRARCTMLRHAAVRMMTTAAPFRRVTVFSLSFRGRHVGTRAPLKHPETRHEHPVDRTAWIWERDPRGSGRHGSRAGTHRGRRSPPRRGGGRHAAWRETEAVLGPWRAG